MRSLMEKLAKFARAHDYLLPWLLLAAVGGATLVALQVLMVRLLR
jgi:hypothetical protein